MNKREHSSFLIFWICFNSGLLNQVNEGRRCTILGRDICCAHFYESPDKECKECNIGYTSENGSMCSKCPMPYYGFHCAFKCNCKSEEICNTVLGCVLQEKEDDGQVIYYAGSAGLFVIVILLGIILYRVNNKCSHRQRVSGRKKHGSYNPTEETIEMDRYESIDELQLEDLNLRTVHPSLSVRRYFVQQQCNVNLDTHYRDSTEGQNESRMEDEGYLHSYQPIQEANIYKHEYEAIGVLNVTKEDYIHTTHC